MNMVSLGARVACFCTRSQIADAKKCPAFRLWSHQDTLMYFYSKLPTHSTSCECGAIPSRTVKALSLFRRFAP